MESSIKYTNLRKTLHLVLFPVCMQQKEFNLLVIPIQSKDLHSSLFENNLKKPLRFTRESLFIKLSKQIDKNIYLFVLIFEMSKRVEKGERFENIMKI